MKIERQKIVKSAMTIIINKGINIENMTLKTQNVEEGRKKRRNFRMSLNLKDYLLKTSRYSYSQYI